jgi:hypothetical protein
MTDIYPDRDKISENVNMSEEITLEQVNKALREEFGRHQRRDRPMLYATIAALGSLPGVALSSAMITALYHTCWCLKALNPKVL